MSDLQTLSAISRRGLLKTGGALLIGFSLAGRVSAQFGPPLGPDLQLIDSWIAIHADNTATVLIGFVELGQGCTTSLPQVAAEELDLGVDQMRIVAHETDVTPYQGGTYSSSAIANGRPQVQAAAAEARLELFKRAAAHLNVPVDMLEVARGVVSVKNAPTRSVTYGELVGDRQFEIPFTGEAKPKPASSYKIIGQPVKRKDMTGKVTGDHAYIQHRRIPDMLHARIIRPRGQGAYGAPPKLLSVEESSIANITGARIVRIGDFLSVVAKNEWDAVRASRKLAAVWDEGESLSGDAALYDHMLAQETADGVVKEEGDAEAGHKNAAFQAEFEGRTPYQAHAPMAPNCALADVRKDGAQIYAASQDIYALRTSLAGILEMPADNIIVQYQESAGTYGHSLYDDAAIAATLISREIGAPVRIQYGREDEHGWDTYGPAHVGQVKVSADEGGKLSGYSYDGWHHSWSFTEANDQLARGTAAAVWPMGASRGVNPAVCGGMYAIGNVKLVDHALRGEAFFRSAWLRSPLDLSFAFTSEQAIDDLAHQMEIDPVEFRRNNIADARWQGVLNAATKAADWQASNGRPPNSKAIIITGRGVGLGTHLAGWGGAVADIEVNRKTGVVRVKRLFGALDAGCTVNPNIVEAQITGQLAQTVSRMLFEEVTFTKKAVTSLDWNSYPIAGFADCPDITPIIVQRIDEPSTGAGEEVMAAAAAAIANAFFDATGRRMTTFPFTPERVKAALA